MSIVGTDLVDKGIFLSSSLDADLSQPSTSVDLRLKTGVLAQFFVTSTAFFNILYQSLGIDSSIVS